MIALPKYLWCLTVNSVTIRRTLEIEVKLVNDDNDDFAGPDSLEHFKLQTDMLHLVSMNLSLTCLFKRQIQVKIVERAMIKLIMYILVLWFLLLRIKKYIEGNSPLCWLSIFI